MALKARLDQAEWAARIVEKAITPKNVQTKDDRVKQVFAVTVDLGDGEGALRPGMPADARLGPR